MINFSSNNRCNDKDITDGPKSLFKIRIGAPAGFYAGVRHELIVYPEAKHGFFCDLRRENFDKTASDDAWGRLLDLFEDELRR